MKLQYFVLLCGFTALGSVSTQAMAQTQSTQSVTNAATDMKSAPKEPVIQLYQALSAIQKTSKDSLAQHTALLNQTLDVSYDFPAIVSRTVGYRYESFTPQEKEAVLAAFKKYTVARYLSSFANDTDTQFKISPDVKQSGANQIVNTTVGSGSDATPINYIIHQTPKGWRIVDVLLNGNISQTAVQRGDFSSTLAKGGSQTLIEMLDQKTLSFNKHK